MRAWIPIVVSLCAISFTIYQGILSRQHAKLSVQPGRLADRGGRGERHARAVARQRRLRPGDHPRHRRHGQPVPTDSLEACDEIARRIGRDPALWDLTCFVRPEEHVLRPSETVVIFASRPTSAHAAEDHTRDVVDYRRLGASARYCSFYEDCWDLGPT